MFFVLLGLLASAGVASFVIDYYDDEDEDNPDTVTEGDEAEVEAGTSDDILDDIAVTDDAGGDTQPDVQDDLPDGATQDDVDPEGTQPDWWAVFEDLTPVDEGTPNPEEDESPAEDEGRGAVVDYEQLVAAEIAGEVLTLGDGDDFVDAMPPGGLFSDHHVFVELDLGGGDDTVVGPFWGSTINGGAGDDLFEVEETGGEVLRIDGGEGNDTIDARTSPNAILEGGAGDDVIHSGGASSTGDGYVTLVDGGAGNDTLHFHTDNDGGFNLSGTVNGGEGTDHFVVAVNDEVRGLNSGDPISVPAGGPETDERTPARSSVVVLGDFDPTTETLELHISSPNEDFVPTSVHIEEDGVVVTYESDIYRDMEKLIVCNTEGLTPEQVTLVGVDPSILVTDECPDEEDTGGAVVDYDQLAAISYLDGLSLGDGDDFVDAMPPGGLYSAPHIWLDIDLGGGDDTIVGPLIGSNLSGGAGDDLFEVEETYGEILSIDGGEGNDTIDAGTSQNAVLIGGAGDDVIHSIGRPSAGTGHVIDVDGGTGNDTLHVNTESDFAGFGRNPLGSVNGGEGTDHFVVSVDDEVHEFMDLNAQLENWGNEAGTGLRSNVVELGDFDPMTETLELHISSPNEDFEPASVHFEADGVVVTYRSDIYPDLEMLIACDTEGLTPEQVTLVGAEPSILVGSDPTPVVCV